MPCDSYIKLGETPEIRKKKVATALEKLEAALSAGSVKVKVGANGALTFTGWSGKDRDGISDLCAYRKLAAKGSPSLRSAIARAEVTAGRKIDERVIASGVHSHDGGKTWGKDGK